MDRNYEEMISKYAAYQDELHLKNQKKIRVGIKVNILVPLIFLIISFVYSSAKLVFLVLWIISLFGIAGYLMYVEFTDYKAQSRLVEFGIKNKDEVEDMNLIGEEVIAAEEQFDAVDTMITQRREEIRDEINERREEFREEINERHEEFLEGISERQEDFLEGIAERQEEFIESLNERHEGFSERHEELLENITEHQEEIRENLSAIRDARPDNRMALHLERRAATAYEFSDEDEVDRMNAQAAMMLSQQLAERSAIAAEKKDETKSADSGELEFIDISGSPADGDLEFVDLSAEPAKMADSAESEEEA